MPTSETFRWAHGISSPWRFEPRRSYFLPPIVNFSARSKQQSPRLPTLSCGSFATSRSDVVGLRVARKAAATHAFVVTPTAIHLASSHRRAPVSAWLGAVFDCIGSASDLRMIAVGDLYLRCHGPPPRIVDNDGAIRAAGLLVGNHVFG